MPITKHQWHFPPRNGGIDFVHDPSATFFNDNPIPKLVREVIQNSLDAREPGISDPVCVTFTDTRVDRRLLGATQLYRHLTSCLKRATDEKHADIRQLYEVAVETLKAPSVRCLRIADSNTTGLKDSRWDALVSQEGSVQKADMGAPGGSFGIGKNAVFNVSDIQTVFYSTHYIDFESRKGRVDKLQGKATLMSHPNPDCPDESLQHIGFYQDTNSQPITGRRAIDPFFQLPEPGTGIFIMGFNPRTYDWADEIIRAVLQNFFYAIHHQSLVVNIEDGKNTTRITHEEIEPLFERYDKKDVSDSYFYYKAIRDVLSDTTKAIKNLGAFDVYIHLSSGPKRMAFVNRNGMLITDSREKKHNPIPPNNRSLWPDYAAVIIPSTSSVDKQIRKMENPSHDAISASQLRDPKEQRRMQNAFKNARDDIRKIMDKKTHLAQSGNQANLHELAEMFPELDHSKDGVTSLETREIKPANDSQDSFVESDNDDDTGEVIDPTSEGGAGGKPTNKEPGDGNGNGGEGGDKDPVRDPGPYRPKSHRVPVQGVRMMTTSEKTILVCFTPTGISPHEVKFSLKAAGEEHENVERISIASVNLKEAKSGQKVDVKEDFVTLSTKETERVVIEVETSDSVANVAFKMGVVN